MAQPDASDITVHWERLLDDVSDVEIAVTLPTFRRPDHVVETLKSVAAQQTARKFVCIVMENDPDTGDGACAAADYLESVSINAIVVNAHRRGNCSAYNAGWHTALSMFPNLKHVLVIDDDEIARPNWLELMARTAETLDVDMVGAPQEPVFENGNNGSWPRHPVFQPAHQTTGPAEILYSSGNVIISTKVLRTMGYPYLDERFNFIGGGDSDFYSRCKAKGYTFGWCADAGVLETIPSRRTESRWLNLRGLRNGSISALIEHKAAGSMLDRVRILAKTGLLLAASPVRSLLLFLKTGSPIIGLYHINVAVGRLLMEFGFANEQYREPEKN
ncbi:MAG: glycosyltransferase [Pseudomonadota bacterium]